MNDLEKELNELISDVPVPVAEVEPEPTPTPTPEPSVPAVPPKEDGGELPPPELPPTHAEGEPMPVAPTPEPAVTPEPSADPKDAIIAQLQETVKALQEQMETVAKHAMSTQTPTSAVPDNEPQVYAFIEKEEDLDEGLKTVGNFNAMMSGILGKFQEMLLGNIQHISMQTADNMVTKRLAVQEFYNANKDLSSNKAFVGIVANELAAANPTWTMEQIMEKLGDEVRNRLRFNNVQIPPASGAAPMPSTPPAPPTPSPAFAGNGGSRIVGNASPLTQIQKDVSDLVADFTG